MPKEFFGWGRQELSAQKNLYAEAINHEKNLQLFGEEKFSSPPPRAASPIEKDLLDTMPFDKGWDFRYAEKFVYGKELKRGPQNIGNCFLPGTLIRMLDGSQKAIEKVQLFDNVFTAERNEGLVTCVMAREVEEPVHTIKLWGHFGLSCTENHPIYTKRGKVAAKDVTKCDWVALPKVLSLNPCKLLQTAEHSRKKVKAKHKVGPSGWRSDTVQLPDFIELDKKFGRFIGLYLAEGSSEYGRSVWSFHKDERELINFVVDTLNDFGVDKVSLYQASQNCVCVRVNNGPLSELLRSLCGEGSWNKRLHSDLTNSSSTFQEAILDGWIEGDGYSRRNQIQGTTVSRTLALDMYNIAQTAGRMPVIQSNQPIISHGVKQRARRYDVVFNKNLVQNKELNWRAKQDEDYVWRKVRSNKSREYKGYVHNFTVEKDHSYIADGFGVANCVGYSHCLLLATKIAHEILVEGDLEDVLGDQQSSPIPYIPYSYGAGRCLAGNMCGGGDGSYCSVQLRASMEYGFLPSDTTGLSQPVPQGTARTGREFGSSKRTLEKWQPLALDFDLNHSVKIESEDECWDHIVDKKQPFQICSNWGFKATSTRKDINGWKFWVHKRSGSWAHSMQGLAAFEDPADGERYYLIGNQWGDYHKDGYWFVVDSSTMASWIRAADVRTIGEITGRPVNLGFAM